MIQTCDKNASKALYLVSIDVLCCVTRMNNAVHFTALGSIIIFNSAIQRARFALPNPQQDWLRSSALSLNRMVVPSCQALGLNRGSVKARNGRWQGARTDTGGSACKRILMKASGAFLLIIGTLQIGTLYIAPPYKTLNGTLYIALQITRPIAGPCI